MTQPVMYPCVGGLDLVTAPAVTPPGQLVACENYEVGNISGYKKIHGFQKYDGGPIAHADRYAVLQTIEMNGSSPALPRVGNGPGNPVNASTLYTSERPGSILALFDGTFSSTEPGSPYAVVGVNSVTPHIAFHISTRATYRALFIESSASIPVNGLFAACFAEWSDYYAWLSSASHDKMTATSGAVWFGRIKRTSIADTTDAKAGDVAEEAESAYSRVQDDVTDIGGQREISGLFWFKDRLYAIRDYLTIPFVSGSDEPARGDTISTSLFSGTYLMSTVIFGSWGSGNAAGYLLLSQSKGLPATSDTLDNDTQSVTGFATVDTFDYVNPPPSTAAGLYVAHDNTYGASGRGWSSVNLGWKIAFKNGSMEPRRRSAVEDFDGIAPPEQNTGQRRCSTGTEPTINAVVSGGGYQYTQGWMDQPFKKLRDDPADPTNPASVLWGQNHAVGTMGSFTITGFKFDDGEIPNASEVTKVEVEITRYKYVQDGFTDEIRDDGIQLVVNGSTFGADKSTATPWPDDSGSTQLYTFDQPGTTVAFSDLRDATFGVRIGAKLQSRTQTGSFSPYAKPARAVIEDVKVRVYYKASGDRVCFVSGGTNVATADADEARVSNYHVTSGSWEGGDASGILYVHADETLLNTVGDNWEIRSWITGAPTGTSLYAKTDGAPVPATLEPASSLTDSDRYNKYEFVDSNFYARKDLNAIYMTNGVGPAKMFDGDFFSEIYTGLPLSREKPTHIAAHQNHLFLGYSAGTMTASSAGEPLSFSALQGAFETGFGNTIIGLYSMNGDALVVFTDKDIQMLQGRIDAGPYQTRVTHDLAAIEYTIVPLGNDLIFATNQGLHTMQSVQEYGDFKPSKMSEKIWPWLSDRVVSPRAGNGDARGPTIAYAVHSKGQYRLAFADGYQLTCTFSDVGPQFTIQNFSDKPVNGPWPINCVAIAPESGGKERIFFSTKSLNDNWYYYDRFAYEMDVGSTFDGHAIAAHFDMSIADQDTPWQGKRYPDVTVFGQAKDYATFTMQRSGGYATIDPNGRSIGLRFGDSVADSSGALRPFMSSVPAQIEGIGVNLRFANQTNHYPHIIQAVKLEVAAQGRKRG